MAEIVERPLGVYLNQRHAEYLEDDGLGYGAIKDLFLNAIEWWNASRHNPLRDTTEDEAKQKAFKRGEALHTHVLDGPKTYDAIYGMKPNRRSHPDALDTVEQLKAACERLGLDTRGLKSDLVGRLVGAPVKVGKKWVYKPRAQVLQHLQYEFNMTGKKEVSEADHFRILQLYRMMMREAHELDMGDGAPKLTLKQALDKALTEVSVYWVDENGIRMRARFDILKPNFTGDLKSITQWKRTDFRKSLLEEVIRRGYMIQDAHYWHARHALRKAVAEGRVYGGTKTQRKLLERIAEAEHWAWLFIFAKMDGAPQVKGIVVRDEMSQFTRAMQQREEAIANYLYQRELHGGLDRPWFDPEVVWEPAEDDWPLWSVLGQ